LLTGGGRGWDRKPIALDGLDGVQLDLRLSAARVSVANARFGRTAVAANLRDGNLAVAIGESQAFGGVVRGTFGLAKSTAGAGLKAQLQFADVDLEQCLGALFGIHRLEGKGNLGLAIDSAGRSVYDVTKGLNGTASLTSRKGAIAGFNVEQLLKRIERRPLSGSGEFRTGKTSYDTLSVNLRIVQGVANVEDVRMEGSSVGLAVAGAASIPERDLDLRGTASLLAMSTSGTAAPAFELPFMVQGSWDDPIILPDPQSRILHSGAAQPILDAVRNRGLRDPVRSAIERLTGSAPQTPPALAGSSTPSGAQTPSTGDAVEPTQESR
jgi:AsmA protein